MLQHVMLYTWDIVLQERRFKTTPWGEEYGKYFLGKGHQVK